MAEVETMSVLVVEPGKKAESRDIPKTLEGMQAVVGGPIEFLSFNGLREHAITVYRLKEATADRLGLLDLKGRVRGAVIDNQQPN